MSGPKGVGGKVRVKTQMGWGMGQCPDPKGVGGLDPWSDPKGSGVGDWGLGRVWTQEGWVRPCPNPRGVGICVCALTQGDWVCVRTQGGWALGPSMSGPNRFGVWGLGFGSFCVRTQGVWILLYPNPRRLVFESFGGQTQAIWARTPDPTEGGPCSDPVRKSADPLAWVSSQARGSGPSARA